MEYNRTIQLQQIVEWAQIQHEVRVVLLTSSLVNPYAPVDQFSDLDIELVVENASEFLSTEDWLSSFGTVIAKIVESEETFDYKHAMRMVLYDDYTKVDFKIYSVDQFLKEVNQVDLQDDWDVGYKVLIDKDNLTLNMKPPTYASIMIKKPTVEEFIQILNDFWWDITYIVKCLARGDIFYAKFMSENNMRTEYLQTIIEWYIGLENDWKVTTNKYGRLFKNYVSPELWTKIEATFSGSVIEENWNALLASANLCHELGIYLAEKLNYPYPITLEEDIRKYMHTMKNAVQ
ncbi:AadS family aminoglycoside 6-adenylyltransferase [Flavobacterium sp. '19STA2R22 D10 B1']|uniref:AadS family aminoglycoside 6-adenylyltransferase n=1 Tax=Flavobacterium aerium TaxID=3037261 RepID=UPI00278C6138|nr:AadS family aminoglycoside 6-adenylyltransferase [Flavobacterium sp. '19STA2R22 D10 B1']